MQNELEKVVLGHLLLPSNDKLDRDIKLDALCELDENLFTLQENRELLKTISRLVIEGKDPDFLAVYQSGSHNVKIGEYTKNLNSIADINKHIWLLKSAKYKLDLTRAIEKHLKEIQNGSYSEDLDEIKNGLIASLSGIAIEDSADFISIQEYTDKIKEQMESSREIEGLSWGVSDIDKWTSGIVRPRLYVLGGLKKSGKTRFIIHVMKTLHEQNKKMAFLSLEMPAYEITKLLYSSFTGYNDLRFRSASFLSREEKYMFDNTIINQDLLGIECKSALSIEQVISRIKRLSKMNFKIIAIDYLQRIKTGNNNRANELEDYSIRIADAARQNDVSIILLSQLNALAENPKEPPNMGSLKGSGGIGEAADVIILFDNLYRRTKKEEDKNLIDLYFEQRYGDSGRIQIQADLGSCTFKNLTN